MKNHIVLQKIIKEKLKKDIFDIEEPKIFKTLEFKLYGNNFFSYKIYSHFLKKYENTFYVDSHKALKKMVNLYIKLNHTCFHDLSDAIELWMYHYGNNMILDYIQNKRDNGLKTLEGAIKNKLQKNNG